MFDWRELYENLMIKISEQAYQKNKAEEIITAEMEPLTEHLIKLLTWEDAYNNPKHLRDIQQKWSKKVKTTSRNSKAKFKEKQLTSILVTEPIDNFDVYYKTLRKNYDSKYKGDLVAYRTEEEVRTLLEKVLLEFKNRVVILLETKVDTADFEDIFADLGIYVQGI